MHALSQYCISLTVFQFYPEQISTEIKVIYCKKNNNNKIKSLLQYSAVKCELNSLKLI